MSCWWCLAQFKSLHVEAGCKGTERALFKTKQARVWQSDNETSAQTLVVLVQVKQHNVKFLIILPLLSSLNRRSSFKNCQTEVNVQQYNSFYMNRGVVVHGIAGLNF